MSHRLKLGCGDVDRGMYMGFSGRGGLEEQTTTLVQFSHGLYSRCLGTGACRIRYVSFAGT